MVWQDKRITKRYEGVVYIRWGETGVGQMGNRLWQSGTDRRTGSGVLYINILVNGKRRRGIINRLYSCTLISREQG